MNFIPSEYERECLSSGMAGHVAGETYCPPALPIGRNMIYEYTSTLRLLPPLPTLSPPTPSQQVAGGGEASQWQIEIFSLNRPTPRAVKSLQVGCAVRCLEFVPEPSPSEEGESGFQRALSGSGANICIGSDDGR